MKKIIILLFLIATNLNMNNAFTFVDKEINIFKLVEVKEEKKTESKVKSKVLKKYTGYITAYGPDCKGCIGITASGFNVKNRIYYHDKEYGKIRIVAADRTLSFGTIVKIKNNSSFKKPVIAIVLDRGSAIGFNKSVYFDLLYKSERETTKFGKQKATFEILRNGF